MVAGGTCFSLLWVLLHTLGKAGRDGAEGAEPWEAPVRPAPDRQHDAFATACFKRLYDLMWSLLELAGNLLTLCLCR